MVYALRMDGGTPCGCSSSRSCWTVRGSTIANPGRRWPVARSTRCRAKRADGPRPHGRYRALRQRGDDPADL